MTLEISFKEEDEIHFLHNDKYFRSIIRGFKIERKPIKLKGENGPVEYTTEVVYLCNDDKDEMKVFIKVPQEKAFATKDSLLHSL